jgi:site-specific DNA-methyltransferase (adenine-specific)
MSKDLTKGAKRSGFNSRPSSSYKSDIPNKSLYLIPYRFAIEMQERGWIVRNLLIWHKPNVMPSSAIDRFTIDFEPVFFFVKNNKTLYWINDKTGEIVNKCPKGIQGVEGIDWDWKEVKEFSSEAKIKKTSHWRARDYYFEQQFDPYTKPMNRWGGDVLKADGESTWDEGTGQTTYRTRNMRPNPLGRNKRAVWTINTSPLKEAHFAIFPEELIITPIKAGCPPTRKAYRCKKCGKIYLSLDNLS